MIELPVPSLKRLEGIHPDLAAVVTYAAELSDTNFIVTEGLRTLERQRQLFATGKSKTMNSHGSIRFIKS